MTQYQDLLKDSSKPWPDDKNYFKLTITDLDPGMSYPLEFRWVYTNDKPEADREWSVVKNIETPAETINAPRFLNTDLLGDGFNIVVKWSGTDYLGNAYDANLDRIDIYIRGGQYGATSVYSGRSFKSSGTETFAVNTSDVYYIKLKAVSKRNSSSSFSAEQATATVAPLVVDIIAPTNPTNISASAEIDPSDQTGFSLKSTITFTKSSDSTCRGYRIRWTTQTVNPVYEYAFVEHPSSGSTVSYTVTGLIPNITYYYQVAAVDELNNTQTYANGGTFTAQDSVATAEGSLARLKSYISIGGATGDQFKFGTGISESINTSTTITPSLSSGTYHGVLLNKTGNKNNYWLTTGQIRVGTDTQFMYFNGTNLYLTGDINAASGKFSGNILLSSSNASLWNISNGYTINSDGTLPASSTGFVLNSSGLQFKVGGDIKIFLEASGTYAGRLTAKNALISGTITASSFTSPNGSLIIDADPVLGDMILFSPPGGTGGGNIHATSYALFVSGNASNYINLASDGHIDIISGETNSKGNSLHIMGSSIFPTSGSEAASNVYLDYSSPATSRALRNSVALTSATATSSGITDGATVATWGSGGTDWVNGDVVFVY